METQMLGCRARSMCSSLIGRPHTEKNTASAENIFHRTNHDNVVPGTQMLIEPVLQKLEGQQNEMSVHMPRENTRILLQKNSSVHRKRGGNDSRGMRNSAMGSLASTLVNTRRLSFTEKGKRMACSAKSGRQTGGSLVHTCTASRGQAGSRKLLSW